VKNIFVGNLSFSASEQDIRSMFENYGTVERVSIITDRETGRSRGFAFVEMPDDSQADRAISALNGADMNGRSLNVNEARPKSERPSGGGGGRGGFGGGRGGGGGYRERRGGY
jgi:cold-inducible RNA-binding protein